MTECRQCLAVDCVTDDPYGLYSLQSEVFPFVLNCPPGYNCKSGSGYFVTFIACEGSLVTRWIAPGSTSIQYDAIIAEMMAELQAAIPFCTDGTVPTPTPTQLYWNQPQSCTATCPDGSVFTYTVPAGRYAGFSLAVANAAAYAAACAGASLNRMCFTVPVMWCCAGVAFSFTISISGGHTPMVWANPDGMPAGTTVTFAGRNAVVAGTIAAGGSDTFDLNVVDSLGNVATRTCTIYCINFYPATLDNATVGVAYSQQLSLTGQPPGTTATYALDSGSLPTGVSLSASGLISGTPSGGLPATFTVAVTVV